MAAAMLVMSVPTTRRPYVCERPGGWEDACRSWYRDAVGSLIRSAEMEDVDSVPASEYRGKKTAA